LAGWPLLERGPPAPPQPRPPKAALRAWLAAACPPRDRCHDPCVPSVQPAMEPHSAGGPISSPAAASRHHCRRVVWAGRVEGGEVQHGCQCRVPGSQSSGLSLPLVWLPPLPPAQRQNPAPMPAPLLAPASTLVRTLARALDAACPSPSAVQKAANEFHGRPSARSGSAPWHARPHAEDSDAAVTEKSN